jgi:hypothetical protein
MSQSLIKQSEMIYRGSQIRKHPGASVRQEHNKGVKIKHEYSIGSPIEVASSREQLRFDH